MREWWIFTSQYIVRIKSYNWNWCLAIEKRGVSGWLDVDQNNYLTTLRIRHSWVSIIFSNSKIEARYQMRWQRCWEWDPNNWYTRQSRLNWKSCWQRIHIGLTPDGNADGSVSSGSSDRDALDFDRSRSTASTTAPWKTSNTSCPMRLRISTNSEGTNGTCIWYPGNPTRYCKYGF